MKEMPKDGEPLPPLLEALQQLKYSEVDNTPEELAVNYKEDGLFHFKIKKYRIAIACFTEAIRKGTSEGNPTPNKELIAQLYNNRAAAQFHLENYRSALLDCEKALEYKEDYFKPLFKAIESCLKLNKNRKALDLCAKAEKLQPDNLEVQRLRLLAIRKQVSHYH
jgi:tetratricopeptide (TPR) repeat protein